MTSPLTYVSLFSSAGVGCFGFTEQGFECVATNELLPRRLDVQRANHKCQNKTGYVLGDITDPLVQDRLFAEVKRVKADIDVVIATPPCQGMSVANHKKKTDEIRRNSLIVKSLELVSTISPKIFVFENVPAFMKTLCTGTDGIDRPIGEEIENQLGTQYQIAARTLNFKNYGSNSSRQRTLVVGVRQDCGFSPDGLFPDYKNETTLLECIGDLPPLTFFNETDPADIYHNFRTYPTHMRAWVETLKEGESAFDNADANRRPHRIIDGQYVANQRKNGDKYRRQVWDKVAPCVHTRNDQFGSQNTVHPKDDRVFSIRELMRMMTIPEAFNWIDERELKGLTESQRRALVKKHELNIRQSIGEAVPTAVFAQIAKKVKTNLEN